MFDVSLLDGMPSFMKLVILGTALFSVIATMTPNEHDNKALEVLYRIINIFGFNFGKAKNDPKA